MLGNNIEGNDTKNKYFSLLYLFIAFTYICTRELDLNSPAVFSLCTKLCIKRTSDLNMLKHLLQSKALF